MSIMQMLTAIVGGLPFGTFNPADKSAAAVLTNNNLTVSTTSGNPYNGARSTSSRTTGKLYFEVTLTTLVGAGGGGGGVGIANSSAALTQNVGNTTNGVSLQTNTGVIFYNATQVGTMTAPAQGDIIGVVVDFGASQVSFNRNGGAFTTVNSFPALSSALFIACTPGYSNAGSSYFTLNTAPTYALPSGAGYWGV